MRVHAQLQNDRYLIDTSNCIVEWNHILYEEFKYSEGSLKWTPKRQERSVHISLLSTVVDTSLYCQPCKRAMYTVPVNQNANSE